MSPIRLLLLCLASVAAAADHPDRAPTVAAALAAAARERRPVLLDFRAQWCYSCYYMTTHVLTDPRWRTAQARAHLLDVDGDSPDGAHWMDQLAVKVLPTYVVLKADGGELGRIVGEQPAAKFYPALERILAGSDALDVLEAKAEAGSIDATAQALAGYQARDEPDRGLAWYAALPAGRRKAAGNDPRVRLWRDRLLLRRALAGSDRRACIAAAQRALDGPVGCERYHVLKGLLDCSEDLPAARRTALLAKQRLALQQLLDEQVFVSMPACADQRSAVLAAADLDAAIGDRHAEAAVLDRAIAFARATLHGDYASDRNLADNLRVYLERAGRMAEYDALLPKLIAAYPHDYVFAYHFGLSLLDRGEPARALPWLEQAAAKSYGVNRLVVAEDRTRALLALHRRAEARKVVAEALKQNGPWFAVEAAKLEALLKS
jgi:thioredoxin-related protein